MVLKGRSWFCKRKRAYITLGSGSLLLLEEGYLFIIPGMFITRPSGSIQVIGCILNSLLRVPLFPLGSKDLYILYCKS